MFNLTVSVIGGAITFVSFCGICMSILLLRDPDPDKKDKSQTYLLYCIGAMVPGVYILTNPEIFHPDSLTETFGWLISSL